MPLVFRYGGAGTIWTPAGDLGNAVVRYQTPTMTHNAEVGDPATSSLEIDDPAGVLQFTGLYHVAAVETSAPSNNQLVWSGVITGEHVKRADSLRTGQARRWLLDVTDENGGLGARILNDASANRPAETAGDRLRYLLSLSKAIFNPFDFGHVNYPTTPLDATDYRGQKAKDLLADCAVHSGYNFWCDYNEAHQTTELFFLDPNSTDYSSTLRISNVLSDVDSSTTFAPYEDATLDRSPSRIAYGVYMPYNGGAVYVTNEATGQAFAHQDQVAPMANVSTAATATTLATKFLNDNNEEDDRISTAILVPPARVNDVRGGQRISARFSHLPSYGSNFSSFRVLQRTVIQEADTEYRIALRLSPCHTPPGLVGYDVFTANSFDHTFSWGPATNGDLLICVMAIRDGLGTAGVASEHGLGAAWTLVSVEPGGFFGDGVGVWTTTAVGGETSATSTGSGSGSKWTVLLAEVKFGSSTSISTATYGASSTLTAPTVTPTAGSAALILSMLAQAGDTPPLHTITAGSGWTDIGNLTDNYHPQSIFLAKSITSASGPYTPTATSAVSGVYKGVTVLIT